MSEERPPLVTAVVSDFGGVLTSALRDAFAVWHDEKDVPMEELGAAMGRLTERDGENPLFALECGHVTADDFFGRLGKEISGALGRSVDMSDFTEVYFRSLDPNHTLIEYLGGLRAEGVRLGLLTNNVREWEPYWRAMLPVDELFEVVVDSAYVGMRKPDERIYHLTCERMGLDPASCAFLDDFAHNCEAAREVGMHPVWYQDDDAAAIAELDRLLGRAR